MNTKQKLLLVSLILFNTVIKAQKDTIIIESSTKIIYKNELENKRKYKYLDVRQCEETKLIKLGISPLFFTTSENDIVTYEYISASIAYEQKLNPALSFIGAIDYDKELHAPNEIWANVLYYIIQFDVGFRYYFLINRKIKAQKSANNFHNSYFEFGLDEIVKNGDNLWTDFTDEYPISIENGNLVLSPDIPSNYKYHKKAHKWWAFAPKIRVGWGIQKRIKKWGYVDFTPYSKFNLKTFEFGLDLTIGLGFGFN